MPDPHVEHLARLARLDLSEPEKERMRSQLDAILTYIDKLRRLNTDDVEPTSHAIPMVNVMREDEVRPCFPTGEMLANAPERESDFVRVPRIIEE
ncbi:MAG: Asp-tRNA(Asn)/Glu-tRNA(Gln) amidotransferase subunit GatC [Candidatus Rokubacteria bacterium]|nr:Asp-tRNA(Asn)/Glu-tRNA(Gln) amidotransferase subunit GatC [Candidatus Rokubacteria bacterium]